MLSAPPPHHVKYIFPIFLLKYGLIITLITNFNSTFLFFFFASKSLTESWI